MGLWRLKKDQQHEVHNVGDLRKALDGVPDEMPIESGFANSAEEPLLCGVYVNDDDHAERYFGISG